MKLLAQCRRVAFWAMDTLKGAQVRTAYNEIKRCDMMDSDNSFVKNHQKKAWAQLKAHATETTDFYSSLADLRLSEFPIITKNDIRFRQEAFMSSSYKKENLIQMATSGSTGTPFICYQDVRKKKRVNAEIIYYSEKVGYRLGDNLSYIRTIVRQVKKTKWKQFLQNQTLINCRTLDDAGISEMIIELQNQSKKGNLTLLGYASTYTALLKYLEKKNIMSIPNCNVTGVISGSEMLYDSVREGISQRFGGINVVSRYSNEENGVIGQDEGINNVFPINEADYIVEIVDDDGRKVPNGVTGRIVVTDLYNYAMPMIRYDTGDAGAIDNFEINGRNKKCICNFSGRKVDVIFDTTGKAISPFLITNHMWSFPNISQFQLIQKDEKKYELKLNVSEDNYNCQNDVVELLKSLIGSDADIIVELVDEIPVLASGKRRYIVNEWKKA